MADPANEALRQMVVLVDLRTWLAKKGNELAIFLVIVSILVFLGTLIGYGTSKTIHVALSTGEGVRGFQLHRRHLLSANVNFDKASKTVELITRLVNTAQQC